MIIILLLFAALLSACEEDVTAVTGTGYPFTMWGILTPDADTQFVRVYPIEGRLEAGERRLLDARFVSRNLATGEVRVWNDSLVSTEGEDFGHVFWSDFRADYGDTYHLEVERSDGAASDAELRVPQMLDVTFEEPSLAGGVVQRVRLQGEDMHLIRIRVHYTVRRLSPGPGSDERTLMFSYDGRQIPSQDGWMLLIDLERDCDEMKLLLGQPMVRTRLMALGMRLSLSVIDGADASGVDFDGWQLLQPGIMDNVRNGFGYVTGGYRVTHSFLPTRSFLEAAGYEVPR
jgi:hypothetical protein